MHIECEAMFITVGKTDRKLEGTLPLGELTA